MNENVAEFMRKPDYVIVHNPCDFGMKKFFENVDNKDNLKEKYLFREIPNIEIFNEEHKAYYRKLKENGVNVLYLKDLLDKNFIEKNKEIFENNPNQVYTRDALITIPWIPGKYIVGKMKSEIRRKEYIMLEEAVKKLGLTELIKIPEEMFLEGGDVIPFEYNGKRVLLIGYERRTSKETLYYLRDNLIKEGCVDEIIGIRLAEWRINLDGGFVPVSKDVIVTHPDSILDGLILTKNSETVINPIEYFKSIGYKIIATTKEDSLFKQTCNCFCVGNNTIFTYNITDEINEKIRENGINVIGNKGLELVKGTGGPRCMTRPIYI